MAVFKFQEIFLKILSTKNKRIFNILIFVKKNFNLCFKKIFNKNQ